MSKRSLYKRLGISLESGNPSGNNQYKKDGISIKTVQERLEENRRVTEDGHWLWLGSLDKDGYGQIWIDNKTQKVHRVSFRLYKKVDLDNKVLVLHKPPCIHRACFSPDHLYTGTNKDNSQDMIIMGTNYESNRIYCPNGHIYSGGNVRIIIDSNGNEHRTCRICQFARDNNIDIKDFT